MGWLDGRLADAGIARTGEVDEPRVRPWAAVLRAPTTAGPVWLKAAAPETAGEVGLYEVLAAVAPDRVLTPIATDRARALLLLPDGGPPLAVRLDGDALSAAFVAALVHYGELQRRLAPHVDDLLARGIADMRPSVMLDRFDEAVEHAGADVDSGGDGADRATHRRVAAMRPAFASWCARLAASAVPASLDHNDLHPGNVLGDAGTGTRFYDWGDSVLAHPFAAMLVPLAILRRQLAASVDDPRVAGARDRYLAGFAPLAPAEDLSATLELACRVAKVARALTWERALRSARAVGDEIPAEWATAPLRWLATLLEPSYLGG